MEKVLSNETLFTLIQEAEKRNTQRFDAQQEAVAVAMLAQEKAVLAAMAAAEKAVTKAEIASEKRFESVNEFRKALSDQTATFITRIEFSLMSDKLNVVDKIVGELREHRSTGSDILGRLLSIAAIVISASTLIFLIFRHV
jgi:histone deacetylase complex regulatory component SIN3